MREPQRQRCPKSTRYPRGEKWSGSVEVRGRQRWVGTFATKKAWRDAALKIEAELRAGPERERRLRLPRAPTVAEFLGVAVRPDGRVVATGPADPWPWSHPRGTTKDSSRRTLLEEIRPFVRAHGKRRVDAFDRVEARELARSMTNGQKRAVRRMFGDVFDDGLIEANPFVRLVVKQTSRVQRGDFRLVSDAEFERLLDCARRSRSDEYARVVEAVVALEGTTGIRPSEIFGMEVEHLNRDDGYIELRHQIDDRGVPSALKNSECRLLPIPAFVLEAIDAAPRLSDRWLLASPRGTALRLSLWSSHWLTVRAMAGLPDLAFYELKHRAITYMITPEPDGLGLEAVDVARIVGHRDGGATISKHYLRLDERKAVRRFHEAWGAGREGGSTSESAEAAEDA